ncbi:uncharacterized protein LOC131648762 [Vicia villosa]|uniref:uncharacterized protein LOC131648762 n=1 Tax=Vicia villosa TaxID=3911 RepID=UPI00273BC85A|nr:uncharacterized protein LOC131648762 [Vicia villosa]
MSVLVNGSPTKEFEVYRGLRQGDLLSPFLYVIAAEGLPGLVRKFIEMEEFASFDIRGECSVDILQFADDTLMVGEGSWKHRLSSLLQGVSVGAMGGWIDGNWEWGDFGISEARLMEKDLVGRIIMLRENLSHYLGPKETLEKDEVWWEGSVGAEFTVASCYEFLERNIIPYGPYGKHDEAFHFLWKAEVPFKVKAFAWRLLLDKLPTKELLVRRGEGWQESCGLACNDLVFMGIKEWDVLSGGGLEFQ